MFIVIEIEEGFKYLLGEIKIAGNKIFSTDKLKAVLKSKPGKPYSAEKIEKDRYNIYVLYSEKGYLGCEITPEYNYREKEKEIDITYTITEGDIYSVEDIIVRGNQVTKEHVIRRELLIKEGEVLNRSKVIKSQRKLTQLGFFNKVTPLTEPGSKPGMMDLIFEVEERETGSAQLGMTYSQQDKLVGFVEISQGNFLGLGQKIYVRYEFGAQKTQGEIGFTEPWLFNKPIYLSLRLYNLLREYSSTENVYFTEKRERKFGETRYKTSQRGFETTFGYRFWNFHNVYLTYEYQETAYRLIEFIKPEAPKREDFEKEEDYQRAKANWEEIIDTYFNPENNDFCLSPDKAYYHPGTLVSLNFMTDGRLDPEKIRAGEQERVASSISSSYVWNLYDDPIDTKSGFKLSYYTKVAGLGGDEYFIKNTFDYGHYFPLPWKLVYGHHFTFSIAKGYRGQDLPSIERYWVGGANTVRAYGEREIADECRSRLVFNFELKRTFENMFTPAFFIDFGGGWSKPYFDENGKKIDPLPQNWGEIWEKINLKEIKGGYGVGIRILLPIGGMIRFDFGRGFEKGSPWHTHFTIGPVF
jgi:outer membrane protein insertion porin family